MKTNDLRYNTSKVIPEGRIYVNIRLNDECKNGHQDFSITGDIYEHKTSKADRYYSMGGCIHEEILKHFPEFETFTRLHLADFKGIPMYAGANGFYHITKGFERLEGKTQKQYFCDYYRVTPDQYEELKLSENVLEFSILLKDLGILKQWGIEAQEAIKQFEELTGNTFIIDSKRTQYDEPDPAKVEEFKRLQSEGYYTDEKKAERAAQARQDKKKVARGKIMSDASKKIEKIETERAVNLFMLNCLDRIKFKYPGFGPDFDFNNWIYYDHTNTIKFNWMDSSYYKKMSGQEFDLFCDNVTSADLEKLPPGILFEMEGEQTFTNN